VLGAAGDGKAPAPAERSGEGELDRRTLLGLAGLTCAVAACGGSTAGDGNPGPADGAAPLDAPDDATPADDAGADACAPGSCTVGANTLVLDLSKEHALAKVGGSTIVTDARYSDSFCGQNSIIVVQPSAGKYVAFSSSCTPQCCSVSFTGQGFSCPCHGSRFNLAGRVTRGPAGAPLPSVPVCTDGCGKLYLTLA